MRREGGTGASQLTAASWITKIRRLFPKETVEILERHALERYQLKELLTDREVLEKLEPNRELLKTILQLKHLMKGEVLDAARRIVKKVAEEIEEKLRQDIRRSLLEAWTETAQPGALRQESGCEKDYPAESGTF